MHQLHQVTTEQNIKNIVASLSKKKKNQKHSFFFVNNYNKIITRALLEAYTEQDDMKRVESRFYLHCCLLHNTCNIPWVLSDTAC